jgi:hypothetical protein
MSNKEEFLVLHEPTLRSMLETILYMERPGGIYTIYEKDGVVQRKGRSVAYGATEEEAWSKSEE